MDTNLVVLCGRFGRDPELKQTPTGKTVVSASVATSSRWNDKEVTQWHKIVAWGHLAEYLAEFGKGDKIMLQGELQTRSWDGKDGKKQYATEVVVQSAICEKKVETGATQEAKAGYQPPDANDDIPF